MPWSLVLSTLAGAAEPALSMPAEVVTLDDGLVVLLLEEHRTDTVALHLTFGVGARDEGPTEAGCAHLFEHLMFEGSGHVPVDKFDEWLTAAGGDNNAYTNADETAYHMSFPSGALDLALFLESDRLGFLDAGLTPANLANQQKIVLQERAEGYAEPNGRDEDSINRIFWAPDHPYHRPVIGTVADIEGFSLEATRSFWERHYRSRNAVLVLVGNFDAEQAAERVRYWFSDVPDRGAAPKRVAPPVPAGASAKSGLVEDDVEERTAYLVWETVDEHHADAEPLLVLSQILSGGQGTRLDDAVYFGSKLASDVGAYSWTGDLAGQFEVYASSPETPLEKLAAKLRKEVDRLAAKPPTAAELDRAKRSIRGWLLSQMEYPEGKANYIADCWMRFGTPDCAADDWAKVERVTADDITRVARTWLTKEPTTFSNVPRGDAASALPGAVPVELP